MTRLPLPIDAVVGSIVAAVRARRAVVLHAPPGSGKTTRVPSALIDAGIGPGAVVVLEPRRLAARAAARRVASERSGTVGVEVGYHVRHDRRVGSATRIRFVTEGILLRQLVADPFLDGVAAVVLDEFHERHLEGDLALAMVREIRATVREDLAIVVMSATLDPAPLCTFLDAELVRVDGTLHPVTTVHDTMPDRRDTPLRVRDAVVDALTATNGDVLVFLPGVAEIRACDEALDGTARRLGLDVLPLHGQLEPEAQDRAIAPSPGRKVVLATNIAESSLTIPGVTAVVDTGLARVLRHDAARGLDVLRAERISLASADQRRGRAGRLGPGWCRRLWALGEERGMAPFDVPEVRRIDLAGPALAVRSFTGNDPAAFGWFEAPDTASLARADSLLRLLGAIDAAGRVTPIGNELLALPLHPRLGRLLVEGRRRGCARTAATIAAMLAERDVLARDVANADAVDGLWERLERLESFARGGGRSSSVSGVDPHAARAVLRALEQIAGSERDREVPDARTVAACVLAGYPDRVARRARFANEATLVGGRPLRLLRGAVAPDAELFVAVTVKEGDDRLASARVALAVDIDLALLQHVVPQGLTTTVEGELDEARGRVVGVRRVRYLDLVLSESRGGDVDPDTAAALLAPFLRKDPWRHVGEQRELRRILARLQWLRVAAPDLELPDVGDAAVGDLAVDAAAGATSLAALATIDLLPFLERRHPGLRATIEREAPDRLRLPSGRLADVDYAAEGGPAVRARMQEFFGLRTPPRIARGRAAIVLHLLAPNGRPQQITKDLDSFWANVYPKVRSELMRRYPRHAWPEDPTTAPPEARPKPRRR